MSEYLMRHHEYIQTLDMQDFLNANLDWDVYRIPFNFKEKIQKINPPLTDEELQKEIESDTKVKKHFYSYDDPNSELPINTEINNKINRTFQKSTIKVVDTLRKYNSLESYDFYSEREEKEKSENLNKNKYVWEDNSTKFKKNQDIEEIKKMIRNKDKASKSE